MTLFDQIVGMFNSPAPTPEVQAQRDAVHAAVEGDPVAAQHPDAAAAGELELTQSCVQLIETDEGCRLTAYPDPGTGGEPWTIGYGHTGPWTLLDGTTGDKVEPGMTISQADADNLFQADLAPREDSVGKDFDGAQTNDNQFSAMLSLEYNIGEANFRASSVLRFHKAGQYSQAADAFLLWNRSAGNILPGLVRRRHQERELYLGQPVTESGT